MSTTSNPNVALVENFNDASTGSHRSKTRVKTTPFSIRLTPEERALLEQRAGHRPLGAFARSVLLEGNAVKRRDVRKPTLDEARYATLLAEFGNSRLSSNMNQLAKAANMGTLEVTEHVEQELLNACKAISQTRDELVEALRLARSKKP